MDSFFQQILTDPLPYARHLAGLCEECTDDLDTGYVYRGFTV